MKLIKTSYSARLFRVEEAANNFGLFIVIFKLKVYIQSVKIIN
jgi:hypothetical protein